MKSAPDISNEKGLTAPPAQRELFERAQSPGPRAAIEAKPNAKLPNTARKIKVEMDGDYWAGNVKPKIRLKGRWLETAGFKAGTHVIVKCITPGVMEVHSVNPSFVAGQL